MPLLLGSYAFDNQHFENNLCFRPVFDTQAAWSVLSDSLESGGMIGLAPLLCHYGAAAGSGEDMVKIKKDLSQVILFRIVNMVYSKLASNTVRLAQAALASICSSICSNGCSPSNTSRIYSNIRSIS